MLAKSVACLLACIGAGDPVPRSDDPRALGAAATLKIRLKQGSDGNRVFVDEFGRQRIFHGTNVVTKGPPWHPSRDTFNEQTSMVAEDFEMMRSAGLNLIRLNVAWPGVEPARGQYNQTYLKVMKDLAAEAATYGIYTMAEMHEDVFSERFCGEGVPGWAAEPDSAKPFPQPLLLPRPEKDPTSLYGFPTYHYCLWFGQLTWPLANQAAALNSAVERLYENYDGLLDAWGGYWVKIAETFKDAPELLGLELINEPNALNGSDPNFGDGKHLQPTYDVLAKRIRKVAPDLTIMFAGTPGDRTGKPETDSKPQGFTHAPGGKEYADRSALAFHWYGEVSATNNSGYVAQRLADARQLGVAAIMSESGGAALTAGIPHLDAAGISWAHWEWKDFCRESDASKAHHGPSQSADWGACKTGYGGGPFPASLWPVSPGNTTFMQLKDLAGTYAAAIAGNFTTQAFDAGSGKYTLSFDVDANIDAPTLVLASSLVYPKGFDVQVSPASALTAKVVVGGVELHTTAGASSGQAVTVTITNSTPVLEAGRSSTTLV